MAVRAAAPGSAALSDVGLDGRGQDQRREGLHVFVPIADGVALEDAAALTRAIAARAEQIDPDIATTAFMKEDRGGQGVRRLHARRRSHRGRRVQPAGADRAYRCRSPSRGRARQRHAPRTSRFTQRCDSSAIAIPWIEHMPAPQELSADLVDEGHAIPVARVQAMHEGKRRARARRTAEG
jgi:hypothetical protein